MQREFHVSSGIKQVHNREVPYVQNSLNTTWENMGLPRQGICYDIPGFREVTGSDSPLKFLKKMEQAASLFHQEAVLVFLVC